MSDDRPNPDIFFTDEEVADMKAKGEISTDIPPKDTSTTCPFCEKPIKEGDVICDECIPF